MTTRPFCIALALAACLTCRAQLTIEQCYEKARANYPLIKRYSLIDKTEGIDLARAAKGYLPQLALSAQASVQSDVTDIPIDLGSIGVDGIEIPTMSRDQYKATIDLSQSIWDGGNISSRRKAVRAQAEADRRQTDVSLYAVNARVNRACCSSTRNWGRTACCKTSWPATAGGLKPAWPADWPTSRTPTRCT